MTNAKPSSIINKLGILTGIILTFGYYPLMFIVSLFWDDYSKEQRQVIEASYSILRYCDSGKYKSEHTYYSSFINSLELLDRCLNSDYSQNIVNAKARNKFKKLEQEHLLISSLPKTFFDFKLIKEGKMSEVKEFELHFKRIIFEGESNVQACLKNTKVEKDNCFNVYHLDKENLIDIIDACKNKCVFEGRSYKDGLLGDLKLKSIHGLPKFEYIQNIEMQLYKSLKHETLIELKKIINQNIEFVTKFNILSRIIKS